MNKEKFTFELIDKYTPDIVIKNLLEEIERDTKGYVIGNIDRYDGPIDFYTKRGGGLAAVLGTMQQMSEMADIQQDLGEHYKYRMMFVDYGTISYPVTIILNEDLAVAYSGRRKDVFTIESMKQLEEMMDTILNSDMMLSFIQSLINESLRQEMKEIS